MCVYGSENIFHGFTVSLSPKGFESNVCYLQDFFNASPLSRGFSINFVFHLIRLLLRGSNYKIIFLPILNNLLPIKTWSLKRKELGTVKFSNSGWHFKIASKLFTSSKSNRSDIFLLRKWNTSPAVKIWFCNIRHFVAIWEYC